MRLEHLSVSVSVSGILTPIPILESAADDLLVHACSNPNRAGAREQIQLLLGGQQLRGGLQG